MESLKLVKGIGRKKSEQFGTDLLEIIRMFCEENNIKTQHLTVPAKQKAKKTKMDTRAFSLDLYRKGRTVPEIARERKMALSTIEEHLAHFVGTGDIPIHEFVSPDITSLIASHFEGQGDFRIGPVKSAFGDMVSWGEIKFVVKHLQYTGKIKPA
jgi:uncharacterized protein YpbB